MGRFSHRKNKKFEADPLYQKPITHQDFLNPFNDLHERLIERTGDGWRSNMSHHPRSNHDGGAQKAPIQKDIETLREATNHS